MISSDIDKGLQNMRAFHLAGIIPIAGKKLDFNFPWHDSLMPVAQDFLAVENAVYEAANAGCETIWIICHKEMQPLIRHRLGDYVIDPKYNVLQNSKYHKFPNNHLKEIPIYYVPIHPKDRKKRDCLGWGVLYGVVRSYHVAKLISRWVVPDKYYVVFPYSAKPLKSVLDTRTVISSRKNVFFSYKGKTVADGEYMSFTMDSEDFIRYRKSFRERANGMWESVVWNEEENRSEGIRFPIGQRYTGTKFELEDVFGEANLENAEIVEMPWYYDISTWDGYCNFLGSEERKEISRPRDFKYHEWNPIGVDDE